MASAANTTFVTNAYTTILLRSGSAADINTWATLIDSGTLTQAQVVSGIEGSAEVGNFVLPVVRMYQTFFHRAPDAPGLQGWVNLLRNGTLNISQIAQGFVGSTEFAAIYGSSIPNPTAFVTALYQNVLGRAPDAPGLSGWVALLNSGTSPASIALGFSNSVEFIANSTPGIDAWLTAANTNANAGVTPPYPSTINTLPAPVSVALTPGVDNITGPASGNATFNGVIGGTLTAPATFSTFDTITGQGKGNVLNLVDTGTGGVITVPAGTVSGVQTVNVQSGEGVDATAAGSFGGVTAINITASTGADTVVAGAGTAVTVVDSKGAVTVTGGSTVAATTDAASLITVTGGAGTTSVSVTGGAANAIADGSAGKGVPNTIATVSLNGSTGANTVKSDALASLSVSNVGGGSSVTVTNTTAGPQTLALALNGNGAKGGSTITDATATTVNVTTSGAASAVALAAAAATTVSIAAGANLDLTGSTLTAVKSLTASGAGGITIDVTADAALAAVDFSATSGANSVAIAAAQAFTGGSGADTVTVTADPTAAVNGGGGTNEIIANFNAASPAFAKISNFAVLGTGKASQGTFDFAAIKGTPFTAIDVTQTLAGATTFKNVASGTSVSIDSNDTLGFTVVTADKTGAADALSLTLGTAALKGGMTEASLTLQDALGVGIGSLTISSLGDGKSTNTITALVDNALTKLVITGTESLTLAGGGSGTVTSIDTTGVAAGQLVSIDTSFASAKGVTINVGAASLTYTGAAALSVKAGDTITAGNGVLTITEAHGNNSITAGNGKGSTFVLGDGNNTVTVGDGAGVSVSATTGTNTITLGNGAGDTVTVTGTTNNTITVGNGAGDVVKVGGGLNIVNLGTGAGDSVTVSTPGLNGNIYTTVNGSQTGDSFKVGAGIGGAFHSTAVTLAPTAVFQDYLNQSVKTAAGAGDVAWFQFGGDTYFVQDVAGGESSFLNGSDFVVKLSGAHDLSTATITGGALLLH